MFNHLLLYSINQLQVQRSTASIYHILTGRRSAQTIQDAHFFQITPLYSIYPQLKREDFEKEIKKLISNKYLSVKGEGMVTLTPLGMKYLEDQKSKKLDHLFQGMAYVKRIPIFIDRLFLVIQTISNLSVENNQFQPISEDLKVQRWVKSYFYNIKDYQVWLTDLYHHLTKFLSKIDPLQAEIFVDRLTGYRRYGLTLHQIAAKHQITIHDAHLLLNACYHQLVDYIQTNQIDMLTYFIPNNRDGVEKFVTHSASKTYAMLQNGYSIEQIMSYRKLKQSTIEVHIVELTYAIPNFDISNFIESNQLNVIINKIQAISDTRLSNIKQQLDNQYSYFQIRLAMAKARLS